MDDETKKRWRKLALVLFILVMVLFGWSMSLYLQHRGKVKVTIQTLPADSRLSLDNKKIKAGTIYLKPGSHTLAASRQYFDTTKRQINTDDIDPSKVIYVLPAANSEQARAWLAQHPGVQQQREAQGGIESAEVQTDLTKTNSIVDQLPVDTLDYRIDYSVNAKSEPEFTITLYAVNKSPSMYQQQLRQFKAEALQFLVDNGVNPDKYKIVYEPTDPGE